MFVAEIFSRLFRMRGLIILILSQEFSYHGYGLRQQKCKACYKTVYFVDQLSTDGASYHKACFRCNHCKGTLKIWILYAFILILLVIEGFFLENFCIIMPFSLFTGFGLKPGKNVSSSLHGWYGRLNTRPYLFPKLVKKVANLC